MQLYIHSNSILYLFSICRSSVFERCHTFWKSSVYQRCVRHVTRSRTRFSREFRARGGDQGTLGSAIAESITRIAINTALSAIGVDERARITRAFNARTTGQIEIKPAIFLHSMNILVSVFQPEEMSSTLFHDAMRCSLFITHLYDSYSIYLMLGYIQKTC